MGLAKRILWVALAALILLVWAAAVDANATSIRPGGGKMVAQPEETVPSSAVPASGLSPTPTEQTHTEQAPSNSIPRDARQTNKYPAIPDFRAVAGIILVILLLRRMKTPRRDAVPTSEPRADSEIRRAA